MLDNKEMEFLYNISKKNRINDIYLILQFLNGNNTNLKKIITFLIERRYISFLCAEIINIPETTLFDNIKLLNNIGIIIPIKSQEIIQNYSIFISELLKNKVRYKETRVYEINPDFIYFFDNNINFFDIAILDNIQNNNQKIEDFKEEIVKKRNKIKIQKTNNNINIYKIIEEKNNNKNTEKIWESLYKEIKGFLVIGQIPPDLNLKEFKIIKRKMAMDKAIDILKAKNQLNDKIINLVSSRIDIILGSE